MIISHKHKFIFMHTQKAAGSTITALCNPHLGPHDIQNGIWIDTLRNGGRLNRKAVGILVTRAPLMAAWVVRNKIRNKKLKANPWLASIDWAIKQYYAQRCGWPATPHPTAEQVRDYDKYAWQEYFKFSVVRNPWDHAVSYYHWNLYMKNTNNVSFKEFLYRLNDWDRPDPEQIRPPRKTTWPIYTIDNKIAVDHVIRFENLDAELTQLSQTLGIPLQKRIKTKSHHRDPKKSIADYYDIESLHLIENIYRKEIECFGYEPQFDIVSHELQNDILRDR
jgi:hypothetical protein